MILKEVTIKIFLCDSLKDAYAIAQEGLKSNQKTKIKQAKIKGCYEVSLMV